MHSKLFFFGLAGLVIFLAACAATYSDSDFQVDESDDVPRISIHQLKSMLDNNDIVVLDTRPKQQWEASSEKIPGAEHHSSFDAGEWSQQYSQNATIALYCA
ncbi:MAG: rhodanese-like domain-containing protein [Desulfovermiculus sp.]